jgi:hypothetical protein
MISQLNSKQLQTLEKFFRIPTASDIRFSDFESLVLALGGQISTKGRASGSRVRVIIEDEYINLHKPHPGQILCKATTKDIRGFFKKIGVEP